MGALIGVTVPPPFQLTDAASISIDGAGADKMYGNISQNSTLSNMTNPVTGKVYHIQITALTADRTLSFGTNYLDTDGNQSASITISSGNTRSFSFQYNGTNCIEQVPPKIISGWQSAGSFTSKIIATTTNPTFGTLTIDTLHYMVEGKRLSLIGSIHQSTAGTGGSGDYELDLSAIGGGFTLDTAICHLSTAGFLGTNLGSCDAYIVSSTKANGVVNTTSVNSRLRFQLHDDSTDAIWWWGGTWHGFGAAQTFSFSAMNIPIT
jgi:hypothetical protein